MTVPGELASIAQTLIEADRRLDALYLHADEPTRDCLDEIYERCAFDPDLGPELAELAAAIERENERAIERAGVA